MYRKVQHIFVFIPIWGLTSDLGNKKKPKLLSVTKQQQHIHVNKQVHKQCERRYTFFHK